MASSYAEQIPVIIHVIRAVAPKTILDIGKGFGKYAFLTHEYCGIPSIRRPLPSKTFADQSSIKIDAVEINESYLFPHIAQLYNEVFIGRIQEVYKTLPRYDLILMVDIIEHLEKDIGRTILRHFLNCSQIVLVATPKHFFQQELYESPHEHHISYWKVGDFKFDGHFVDYQNCYAGRVFLLSPSRIEIRGFGSSLIKRARRIARALLNEF